MLGLSKLSRVTQWISTAALRIVHLSFGRFFVSIFHTRKLWGSGMSRLQAPVQQVGIRWFHTKLFDPETLLRTTMKSCLPRGILWVPFPTLLLKNDMTLNFMCSPWKWCGSFQFCFSVTRISFIKPVTNVMSPKCLLARTYVKMPKLAIHFAKYQGANVLQEAPVH